MKRYAVEQLLEWKNNQNRKPLLIQGARQVGKTWLMKEFGKTNYSHVAYISFNDSEEAKQVFNVSYNIDYIISALELLTNAKIVPHKTLIILDEIQECDRALNALKFFNENAPEYHIMAAGSLLGVALRHKNISFPVGQIEFLKLNPLTFCEFLGAINESKLENLLNTDQHDFKLIEIMHDKLITLLKQYFFIGGMPEVIANFIKNKDYAKVRAVQKQILLGYENDFSKYINTSLIPKVQATWDSIPYQLSKENKKFAYNKVAKGARAREYENAIEWLKLCGLVHKVHRVSKPNLPMSSYETSTAFKLYSIDCGLLCAKSLLDAQTIIEGNAIFTEFKGALTEQYVLQELKNLQDLYLAYWATDSGTAEIDFIFQNEGYLIPLEVKANISLKARSLTSYRAKYNPTCAIRTSLANYKTHDGIIDIPLYMVGGILDVIHKFLHE